MTLYQNESREELSCGSLNSTHTEPISLSGILERARMSEKEPTPFSKESQRNISNNMASNVNNNLPSKSANTSTELPRNEFDFLDDLDVTERA